MPRLLFCLNLIAAGVLVLLVIGAPFIDHNDPAPEGWPELTAIFARDLTMRRTALASAMGLVVTACVFFRPPKPRLSVARPSKPPTGPVVGA